MVQHVNLHDKVWNARAEAIELTNHIRKHLCTANTIQIRLLELLEFLPSTLDSVLQTQCVSDDLLKSLERLRIVCNKLDTLEKQTRIST